MIKRIKKKQSNQGNSFLVVVATVSFLMVLVTAILVAVALCYRLKAYDINARDNFYYLEQAMDEIYAGVGDDSMKYLNEAYDETLEVMVYYDTKKQAYVTMDNDEANRICKDAFIYKVQTKSQYTTATNAETRLKEFLSYPYDVTSRPDGVDLKVVGGVKKTDDDVTIYNLVLSREATYSTVNTRSAKRTKDGSGNVAGGDTFVQTITTDLVIAKPAFDVNFNTLATDMEELYKYSFIADMGIEITGENGEAATGSTVSITGNVYAASDFYNKSYNENAKPDMKDATVDGGSTTVKSDQIQNVNSYKESDLKKLDGVTAKSMYSGLYVDGATLLMASDRIIVPGTIAAMNCADVSITSVANASNDVADVWADGIVLDGYSLKKSVDGTQLKGSKLDMKVNLYISDDMEVNANSAEVKLNGQYYGYNYAATDNRVYTDSAIKQRTVVTSDNKEKLKKTDGRGIENQAHYNSSAIILNGANTSLDFSNVDAMYVAGQAYIEVSKDARKATKSVTTTDPESNDEVTEEVETKTYNYLTEKTTGDAEDQIYTLSMTATGEDNSTKIPTKSIVQDIPTGEAVSVKSNQLAYIPNWAIMEKTENELYVKFPDWSTLPDGNAYRTVYDTYKDIWDDMNNIPVIKTVISGKTYYFFDFSQAVWKDSKQGKKINDFIEAYSKLFEVKAVDSDNHLTQDEEAPGKTVGINNYDITDYPYFQVEKLQLAKDSQDEFSNIYTNAAITTKVNNTFTIKANVSNRAALIAAAGNINAAVNEGSKLASGKVSLTQATPKMASDVTTKLQSQYKEVKWLLTNSCAISEYVSEAHDLKEDYISPINHFCDFSKLDDNTSKYYNLKSKYGVWISDGDVKVGSKQYKIKSRDAMPKDVTGKAEYSDKFKDGIVRGIIIAKGDVTFDKDVKQFEGLIITGGKIIINNFSSENKKNMKLFSSDQIVRDILKECDASRGEKDASDRMGIVCDIFRQFQSTYVDTSDDAKTQTASLKSVSAVEFEDILSFKNWKKNVD